jgi:hypothetical protein
MHALSQHPHGRPGYPLVPILFMLVEAGICVVAALDPAVRRSAVVGAGWIAAAVLVRFVFFRRRD